MLLTSLGLIVAKMDGGGKVAGWIRRRVIRDWVITREIVLEEVGKRTHIRSFSFRYKTLVSYGFKNCNLYVRVYPIVVDIIDEYH